MIVAQPLLKDIYGSNTANVDIKPGITVAANLSPSDSSGTSSSGLKGIGLADNILIEGTLENIFGEMEIDI